MMCKVALDCFYIAVRLTVYIDLDAAKIKVFKIERVTLVRAVERLIIDHRDDYPARNLSCEEPFVHVVSHAGPDAVAFAYDASNRILGISNFKRFSLRDKHARGNVNLTNQ